jgi:hypothetical protein
MTDNDYPRSGRQRPTSQRNDNTLSYAIYVTGLVQQRWQSVILVSLHKHYAIGYGRRIVRLEQVALIQEVLWDYAIARRVSSGHLRIHTVYGRNKVQSQFQMTDSVSTDVVVKDFK